MYCNLALNISFYLHCCYLHCSTEHLQDTWLTENTAYCYQSRADTTRSVNKPTGHMVEKQTIKFSLGEKGSNHNLLIEGN